MITHVRQLHIGHLIIYPIPLPLRIDTAICHPQRQTSPHPNDHKAQLQPMPEQKLGRVLGAVEITRHRPAEIPKPDLQRHARGALVAAGEIVRDPGHIAREGGVDAGDGDEDARVHEAGEVAVGGGGDGDDEADQDGRHGSEDEVPSVTAALHRAVGEVAHGDGEDGREDVHGHGEQLGRGRFVAEVFDDGGQEEGDAVQRAHNAPVHQDADVDLPVGEGWVMS